jgi:hypothetical protein
MAPKTRPPAPDFDAVFLRLRAILRQHARRLVVTADTPDSYSLDARVPGPNNKPLLFGAVQRKKNYVSYYLMPVYMYPDLLAGLSPELRKRMQGKSCFNFKTEDKALFAELTQLTQSGLERLTRDYPAQ